MKCPEMTCGYMASLVTQITRVFSTRQPKLRTRIVGRQRLAEDDETKHFLLHFYKLNIFIGEKVPIKF